MSRTTAWPLPARFIRKSTGTRGRRRRSPTSRRTAEATPWRSARLTTLSKLWWVSRSPRFFLVVPTTTISSLISLSSTASSTPASPSHGTVTSRGGEAALKETAGAGSSA